MGKRLRTAYRVLRAYRRARLLLALLGAVVGASAAAHSTGLDAVLTDPALLERVLPAVMLGAIVPWILTELAWRWHRRRRWEEWQ